jgi:hypothetical protein
MRSATFLTAWVFSRHFEAVFTIGQGANAMWYHAGSWAHRCGERRIAARLVLFLLAALSILMMSSFILLAHWPLVGDSQFWRKEFIRVAWHMFGGAAASIMMSVTIAHGGHVAEKLR